MNIQSRFLHKKHHFTPTSTLLDSFPHSTTTNTFISIHLATNIYPHQSYIQLSKQNNNQYSPLPQLSIQCLAQSTNVHIQSLYQFKLTTYFNLYIYCSSQSKMQCSHQPEPSTLHPSPFKSNHFNVHSTLNNQDKTINGGLKSFQKYEVIVENEMLQNEIKLIEWRSKTQFPIVKILFYKVLPKKQLNQCSIIQVAIENYSSSLHSLPKMPLYQNLYLLKQGIIGFERLFDRFGSFDISSKMVFINKKNKCRVWMNENVTLGYPSKKSRSTKYLFKNQIGKLFEQKCIKSTLSVQFYQGFYAISKMTEIIQFIENFIDKHKIVINNQNSSITSSSKPLQHYTPLKMNINETIKKIPTFVKKLKQKSTLNYFSPNKSFDTPNCRKTLKLNRDLSQKYMKHDKNSDNSDIDKSSCHSPLTPKSNLSSDNPKRDKKHFYFKTNKSTNADIPKKSPSPSPSLSPKTANQFTSNSVFQSISALETNNHHKFKKTPQKHDKYQKLRRQQSDENILIRHNTTKQKQNLFPSQPPQRSSKQIEYSRNNLKNNIDNGQQQQTMTIKVNEVSPSNPIARRKGDINLKDIIQSIKVMENSNQLTSSDRIHQDIIEKNGWLKTLNNLTINQLRDTLNSHCDGNDVLSNELMFSQISLELLGHMGKELRGTINISGDFLMQKIRNNE